MSETIKEWAKRRCAEMIKDIKWYIDDGMNKEKALELVLSHTTIGSVYKGQIEYEIKYYN